MPRQSTLNLKLQILSEEQEQADLIDKIERNLHLYPALEWVYHVPNGGWRGKIAGMRMKRAGVRPGVPDLALDIARGGYYGLRIELKKSNASPSDTRAEQRKWHAYLREQGYAVYVCKGCAPAWKVLVWYLSLPPTLALCCIDELE